MTHPFIPGEQYFDRNGVYTVIRIEGRFLVYRYPDGTEKRDEIEAKARIYKNILGEQKSLHPHQSRDYFHSLGFLARHSDFQAEVPPQGQANFEEHYYYLTGTRPVLHQEGYYPIPVQTSYDKWGPELRIYLPDSGRLELPPGVEVREGSKPGTTRINNNGFWWQLVRVGFRLGTRHEVARVRETIPPSFRSNYDTGYNS